MEAIMPTYTFENTKTGEVWDDLMSYSEKVSFLEEHPHIKSIITQVNIVTGEKMQFKNSSGWNTHLDRIAAANPNSALAEERGGKDVRTVKTRQAVEKWRKKRAADPNK